MRTEVTLVEAIHILRAKVKWIMLCGVLAAAVMASFTAFFVAPTYSASTTMYIYTSQTPQTPGSITSSELLAAESMARTCREILLSNCVLSQVRDAVSGDEITELTTEQLMDMIHISTVSDTQLLKIQVVAHDPVQAKRIADAFSSIGPAEILRITKAGGVEIVDHARLPDQADDPHILKNAIFALVAGWAIASVYFLLRGIFESDDSQRPASRSADGARPFSVRPRRRQQSGLRKELSANLMNKEITSREHHDAPAN